MSAMRSWGWEVPKQRTARRILGLVVLLAACSPSAPSAAPGEAAAASPAAPDAGADPSVNPSNPPTTAAPTSAPPGGGHSGDPVIYAGGVSDARTPIAPGGAAARVMRALATEPKLGGIVATMTPSGLDVTVTLTTNDENVRDEWLAQVALGAVAELVHGKGQVANDLIARSTAVGPNKGGRVVTTDLGAGAVRLGQVFGSPGDAVLLGRVRDVAARRGLAVADVRVLHPLESALAVTFVVPDGARIDWTIDDLRVDLTGAPPEVEGVLIELVDPRGAALLSEGAADRTGAGSLWFAPGQDARFGAAHGGTPGK
jgi:hypothetical protein